MAQDYNVKINRYNGVDNDGILPKAMKHHATHEIGGDDIITPASIGAITWNNSSGFLTVEDFNNANFPYPYEGAITNGTLLGIADSHWFFVKYFRHLDNNGFGSQLAIGLDAGNKMFLRTSNGTTWNPWTDIITGDNFGAYFNSLFSNNSGAKIATGSYVGTGTYGPGAPTSIILPFSPKFVTVSKNDQQGLASIYVSNSATWVDSFLWVPGQIFAMVYQASGPAYTVRVDIVLSGNTISWNSRTSSSVNSAQPQCNTLNATYNYIAIG